MKTIASTYYRTFAFAYVLLASVLLFTGCAEWDRDGFDFRNYLRDKHTRNSPVNSSVMHVV